MSKLVIKVSLSHFRSYNFNFVTQYEAGEEEAPLQGEADAIQGLQTKLERTLEGVEEEVKSRR